MRKQTLHGFTIVEMLVVVGIVGLLAAITVPNIFIMMQNARSRDDARLVVQTINNARNTARNERRCVIITPATGPARLDVEKTDCAGTSLATKTRTFPSIASLISSSATLDYDDTGALASGTNETITLTSNGNMNFRVAIRGVLGSARLEK